MSRTEFKILKEDSFWAAIYKAPGINSDEICIKRGAHKAKGQILRPVHRLDRETQGLLFLASDDHWENYHQLFKSNQKEPLIASEKIYLAGAPSKLPAGLYEGFIGSRYRSSKKTVYTCTRAQLRGYHSIQAAQLEILDFKCPKENPLPGFCHKIRLISGRRHQIRSFFSNMNAPLVGDSLYGSKIDSPSLALYSWQFTFVDPLTGLKHAIESPLKYFC